MTQSVKLTFAQAVPKILFASAGDVRDPDYWSGIPYHMRMGMERAGWEVDTASPLNDWAKYLNVIAKVAARSKTENSFGIGPRRCCEATQFNYSTD